MQGKKHYQEKLFVSFRLSEHVPEDNFYRRLKQTLDFSWLPAMTRKYYGREGQKSIDPVVFFKLMLIGYIENVNSDRKIIEQASMRLDMLYFLGYDLDEPLPWHSTLSRTRKLLGQEVFLELFRRILRCCTQKGMVSGRSQAVDSAFIKANASTGSLVEKEVMETSSTYLAGLTASEESQDKKKAKSSRKGKQNDRFLSRTDPDARLSQKRGKPVALHHLGIISVDTESHLICGATVDFADKRDSGTLEKILSQTRENLQESGIYLSELLADRGYSSGQAYKYLQGEGIQAYIPPHGNKRASTVEHVWATLLHYRRMSKVYTKGNVSATKQLLVAAAVYNLKKLMDFTALKSAACALKKDVLQAKKTILLTLKAKYQLFYMITYLEFD